MKHFDSLPLLESLEPRNLLSANPTGLTPAQIRHAYGFDQVSFLHKGRYIPGDGRGQTIAIITAFDAPTIKADFNTFSRRFNLPTTDAYGQPSLSVFIHNSNPPADAGWGLEAALDVQWAHAVAPKAHILLVEAASDSTADLLDAVDYARNQPGVVSVSMSWGGHESPFDAYHDDYLSTPAGHIGGYGIRGGITFVSASGDNGQPASWPAVSTHVVAVGGTSLNLNSSGNWSKESAWSGSGGGISQFQGTYAPDVAYDADPTSGFSVYDSYQGQGWQTVGGTSAGCPQWAALFAIVNEGRGLSGKGSLDGPSQTLNALYSVSHKGFHDITTGQNDNYRSVVGYDLVTGRGSPIATRLIPNLANWSPTLPATKTAAYDTAPATTFTPSKHRKDLAQLFSTEEIA